MKRWAAMCIALVLTAAAAGVLFSPVAEAQGFTAVRPGGRGGSWEFYLPLSYIDDAVITGKGGSSVDLNSDWGLGFGFGYNVNDHFQVNGIFTWAYRSYDATVVQDNGTKRHYSNYMDSSTLAVNGVFYLLDGKITPFVSGGVGITYVDTNIQNAPASGSCWYDPWWGYVCSSYVPTKTENDISYTAGVGVRFDISREFALQGSYNKLWIDMNNTATTPDFDAWRVDFIFRM